jgi:DNA-binding CsgD family transcriptional regulator
LVTTLLRGRDSECAALNRLLDAVRVGESRILVLRGEPGVGKTALLDYTVSAAPDLRVLRAVGVESEMELAFASLQQLCSPTLDWLDRLPGPQQDALGVALGLRAGQTPDRFLVALAALSLLSEAAEERPLLCALDDAQWLDEASALTLAFVARRLLAEPVAIVFATREPIPALRGRPELVLGGIGDDKARLLLASAVVAPLDERVHETIIAEARGNPLALLELPRTLTPAELAGGFALAEAQPLTDRIQESFHQRVQSLPPESQRLLLTAAAEPVGDVTLLWRAAQRLGIGFDAAGPAEAAGLFEIGVRVRFRHPLVRSVVYRAAPLRERREVHRALADATDAQLDPDRRAWHRAYAAEGPDEAVADELERSAGRAQARGGLAAAAAFLERATALTPDPARRGMRAVAAAGAMLGAGAFDTALVLLTSAKEAPLDALPHARIDLLRAQIAFASSHGSESAPLLLAAARRLEPLDDALARETYLEAFTAAILAGRTPARVADVARAVRRLPPAPSRPRIVDLLLESVTALFADGYAAAAPIRQRAVHAIRSDDLSVEEGLRWLWLASSEASELWDEESWSILAARHVEMARAAGALSVLPLTLHSLAVARVLAGELKAAASLVEELDTVQQATGTMLAPYAALALAAWRGREQEVGDLIQATLGEVLTRGEGVGVLMAQWARAVLANGLGRYDEAVLAAREAAEHPHDPAPASWGLSELVEAAARSDQTELAADAFARLEAITGAGGTDWALGIQARAHALLSDGDAMERLYREAIERLGRTRLRGELARACLLYGEWLRRRGRRVDARQQLRAAHELFSRIGAEAFAERARRELRATGLTARRRTDDRRSALTPQEAQIARLAQDGLSNPEIAARLFISPRTVQYHLHKVFQKLHITSRNQLGRLPAGRVSSA